jgi:hypothetical protein
MENQVCSKVEFPFKEFPYALWPEAIAFLSSLGASVFAAYG